MFRTSDPQKFIEVVKNEDSVKVYVQSDITSLCSLKLLSGLLSKEYVKHEVIFIEDRADLELERCRFIYLWHGKINEDRSRVQNYLNSENHNRLINSDRRIEFYKEECLCDENNLECLINMYYLCKPFNFLNDDTLWACLIPFSFYKWHLFLSYEETKETEDDNYSDSSDEMDFSQDTCSCCLSICKDLNFEVRKLDSDKNSGVVYTKGPLHPLLAFSDVFSSLKSDIHFVIKNKLLYKKRKDIEEMKIKTYLAHKGISIKSSRELYSNLDHNTKRFISRNFHNGFQYFYKRNRAQTISAVDIAYILNYLLMDHKTTEAYLFLNKFTSPKMEQVASLFEIISQIKQSLVTPIKYEDIIIYKIKSANLFRNLDSYIRFIHDIIGIFMRSRHPETKYLVVTDSKDKDFFVLNGMNVTISNLKIKGITQIEKKIFYKIFITDEK